MSQEDMEEAVGASSLFRGISSFQTRSSVFGESRQRLHIGCGV